MHSQLKNPAPKEIIQYNSYPHAKFDTLSKIAPSTYEGSAPVALNEWL